ncbi:hypothetical protein NL676_000652 [Syzygium grande]|nr:hypothetical protein NL676_000652 [Syzygium grande]
MGGTLGSLSRFLVRKELPQRSASLQEEGTGATAGRKPNGIISQTMLGTLPPYLSRKAVKQAKSSCLFDSESPAKISSAYSSSGYAKSGYCKEVVVNKLELSAGCGGRVAFEEAMKYGGKVVPGHPEQVTLLRTTLAMQLWEKTKLLVANLLKRKDLFFFMFCWHLKRWVMQLWIKTKLIVAKLLYAK